MIKFKVFEDERDGFEKQLNEFVSQPEIEILDIQYSTSATPPDDNQGWCTINFHNALVKYIEHQLPSVDEYCR